MSQTSFVDLASTIIAEIAAETDAKTTLVFTHTAYTRANPWEEASASTPVTETVTGFVLPPGVMRIGGQLIEQNMRAVYVAKKDLTTINPGLDTTVTFGGKEYAIQKIYRYPEGDNPALLEIMVET